MVASPQLQLIPSLSTSGAPRRLVNDNDDDQVTWARLEQRACPASRYASTGLYDKIVKILSRLPADIGRLPPKSLILPSNDDGADEEASRSALGRAGHRLDQLAFCPGACSPHTPRASVRRADSARASEQDLGLDTSTRGVDDVSHALVAVASRALSKAQAFIDEHAPEGTCAQKAGLVKELPQAVGSYDELVQRADVDCVYVGTPHPQHYENARLAIEAGKNVLLEKPATLNAAEWSDLVRRARAKDVFLMEGAHRLLLPECVD